MARRVLITVAEISGDRHAANFARALKKLDPEITIDALGGDALRAAGAVVHHDTVSRAAMGLAALARAPEVRRLLAWAADYYRHTPPDLHVCVDSWSMNWHFARLARQFHCPVLYYIAPQAWASRPGRVKRLRQYVDRLACILPFEQGWFGSRGVNATFVGHPLFDQPFFDQVPPAAAPPRPPAAAPVIGLLPGSRRGIAAKNLPPLIEVGRRIQAQIPTARFVIPTTSNTASAARNLPAGFTARPDAFDELIPACDLCITVSGTATLHTAAHHVPMIVVYRASRLLWRLVGRWIINARTFALVNILSPDGKRIVPEFIPWSGKPAPIAAAALEMLTHPEKLADQRRRLDEMLATLNKPGASRRTAELAIDLMRR